MNEVTKTNISVVEKDGEFYVTSLQVAEHFEKNHRDVLRAIETLGCSRQFRERNFALSNYKSSQGKNMPMHLMTRNGFSFLAMGFTGSTADMFKEQYIEAFDLMERELTRVGGAGWLQKRIEGKLVRRPLTSTLQRFIQYSVDQGSSSYKSNPNLAYIHYTKMPYKALFMISKKIPDLRDKLSIMDLNTLSMAERIVTKTISDCMDRGMYYKDIFKLCKQKIESLAEDVGVSDQRALEMTKNPFKKLQKDSSGICEERGDDDQENSNN